MDIHQHSQHNIKPKSSTKQLELHVASVYSQIAQMIAQKGDLQIQMPVQVPTAIQRVNLIKSVLAYLLDQIGQDFSNRKKSTKRPRNSCQYGGQEDDGNNIECVNCQNYEKNLQKLEGQIRNHIRTHQQLKLYQDGLEQKIQEYKKEKKQYDKKYESTKKKYEESKFALNSTSQKIMKLQQQNQKLKSQIRQFKTSLTTVQQEPRKQLNRYESNKQNLSEWRNSNFNEKQRQRNSIQKRPQSTQRMRVSVNVRSNKGIPISSKIIQEKAKQQKAKLLKNRLGF